MLGHEPVPILSVNPPSSPSLPNNLAHKPSENSLVSNSSSSSPASVGINLAPAHLHPARGGFFSRFIGSTSTPSLYLPTPAQTKLEDGPVEDLIVAGTSFG